MRGNGEVMGDGERWVSVEDEDDDEGD